MISVPAGQSVSGISVKLIPHGVVAGKVTDEDGDPVAFVSVQVLRERWIAGRRQYTPVNAGTTNDLGEYRVAGLQPGRYFVMINHNRPEPGRAQPRAAGAVADQTYANQFYPGVAEISQASPVEIAPGQELRGMDFQTRKMSTFRIRGKVLDESGKPAQAASVMAAPAEGYFLGMRGMGVARNADGSFEITGVQPGSYTLIANRGGRGGTRSVARLPVQVGTRDLDGVTLQLQPTFAISGTVRAPEGVSVANARITLESLEPGMPFGAMGTSGPVDPGGAWTAANVAPGRYRFAITPVPQGTYLKAVTVQGQDITAGALVSAPATGVEILLGTNAPAVGGTALGPDKEPVTGATVVLVPDTSRRDQYWLFRQTAADANGSFSFTGVSPGQYSVFAFRDVEEGVWFSPDFLRPLEGKGTPVKLAEGAAESIQVAAQ
jgi:protocatechuate 3,4-dioxygenase beta subunit